MHSVALAIIIFFGTLKTAIRFCLETERISSKAGSKIRSKKGHPFGEDSVEDGAYL